VTDWTDAPAADPVGDMQRMAERWANETPPEPRREMIVPAGAGLKGFFFFAHNMPPSTRFLMSRDLYEQVHALTEEQAEAWQEWAVAATTAAARDEAWPPTPEAAA
jgi:hypothetical protein